MSVALRHDDPADVMSSVLDSATDENVEIIEESFSNTKKAMARKYHSWENSNRRFMDALEVAIQKFHEGNFVSPWSEDELDLQIESSFELQKLMNNRITEFINSSGKIIDTAKNERRSTRVVSLLISFQAHALNEMFSHLSGLTETCWKLQQIRSLVFPGNPTGPIQGEAFDADAYADSVN